MEPIKIPVQFNPSCLLKSSSFVQPGSVVSLVASSLARNSLCKRRWKGLLERAGRDALPLGKQTAFDTAARGKNWKRKEKKKKENGQVFARPSHKNLVMRASAVKSHNRRTENIERVLPWRGARYIRSSNEILFPAGDSVVFSEQRPSSAISSFLPLPLPAR